MKWNTYGPGLFHAYRLYAELLSANAVNVDTEIDGKWVPARPVSSSSIWQRFRYAWLVFTGRADVLYWPKQEHAG